MAITQLDLRFKNKQAPAINDTNLNSIITKVNEVVSETNTQDEELAHEQGWDISASNGNNNKLEITFEKGTNSLSPEVKTAEVVVGYATKSGEAEYAVAAKNGSALANSISALNNDLTQLSKSVEQEVELLANGYNIDANGRFVAETTMDVYIAKVIPNSKIRITNSIVCGYYTSKPTLSSVTYNGSRVVGLDEEKVVPSGVSWIGIRTLKLPTTLSVLYIPDAVAELKQNLIEQKILGWTTPSDFPIKNTISGNVLTQNVVRFDLGTVTLKEHSSANTYYFTKSEVKANSNNIYVNGYTTLPYSVSVANMTDKSIKSNGTAGNKTIYIKDTAKSEFSGTYVYCELENPITYDITGENAIDELNESLNSQGLDDKFDGQLEQGSIGGDGAKTPADNRVRMCGNPIKVNVGDELYVEGNGISHYTYFIYSTPSITASAKLYANGNWVSKSETTKITTAGYAFLVFKNNDSNFNPSSVTNMHIYTNNRISALNQSLFASPSLSTRKISESYTDSKTYTITEDGLYYIANQINSAESGKTLLVKLNNITVANTRVSGVAYQNCNVLVHLRKGCVVSFTYDGTVECQATANLIS